MSGDSPGRRRSTRATRFSSGLNDADHGPDTVVSEPHESGEKVKRGDRLRAPNALTANWTSRADTIEENKTNGRRARQDESADERRLLGDYAEDADAVPIAIPSNAVISEATMTARRGGPFQPVNTLSRDSSRVSSGGMFHRTSSHSTSAKRPLDTHAVAGGNVRKEWDLHDEAGYGRANKKNRTEDHLAPGRQANGGKGSMATVGEADEALDRSRIVKRKTSSSPSVTSQGLPRRKTTNASSKGGVTEYQAVEQLMSQRSGSSRTIDERQSFKELESYQPEKAQEGQYRGTANLRPPKRAGNDEMRVANGARKQSAPTSVKTSISAARLTPNRAPQRASKPGTEQVPKISVRPQSGSGAGQTTRPRALRDLAIRSNGTVDEVDELESPDPLQAGISVERRTRQDIHADSPAGYSKNAGRGPSDSASKESFALREISSAADIPSTQFTKSNRREVLQISRACIAGSKDGSTWTGEITLVRCGRHDVRMTDELPIFLHLRNGHVEFREGDNILSEISLDLAFKVDDIQSLLRAVDGPKMEIIKHRASNTDNRVDLEFSSNTSAQAFVKRVQQLNRRVVVQDKESGWMHKCFENREGQMNQQKAATRMVSHPLSGNDETNFLSRKRNLARTTKEPDERDPSRSSKRARVADLLEGSRTTGPGNTEGGSGSQPLDLTANTPETRSKARKLAGPQAQPRGGPLPGERPVEVQTHAENAVGKPWDGPVVYPPQGERKRQTTVDHSDLPRLDEGEFLNDNLISFYLRYLEHELEQTQPDVAERVYIFNTFFYERLTKTERGKRGINYQAVQKWTSKIDIFGYDFLVVPINENAHWYVAIICNLPNLRGVAHRAKTPLGESKDEILAFDGPSDRPGPLEAPETREVPRTTTEAPLGIDTELDSTEQGVSRMTIVQAPSDVQPDSRSSKSASTPPLGGGPEASVEQVGGLEDADVEWPPEDEAPPEFAASQIRPTPKVTVNLSENKPDNPQDATTSKTEAAGLAASPSRRKGKRKSLPPLKKYNPDETVIITLDSLGVPHPVTTRNLKLYLQAEGASKRNIEIDTQDISGVSASRQIPQQDNFCDCGLFLLGYMRKFLEDPMGVVTRLLQREMDPDRDWPEMNPSQMRREIRNILIGLGRDQALRRKEDRKAVARKNGRYHDRSATKGTAKVVVKEQGLASASEDAVVLGKSRMDEGTAEKCPEPRETGPGAAAKPDENVQAETSVPNAPEGDDDNQDDSLVITDSRPVPKERKLAEDVFTEAVRPPPSSPVRPRRTPRYSTPEQVMKRGNAPSRSNSPLTPQMYSSPKARRELGLTRLVVEMPVMEGEEEL